MYMVHMLSFHGNVIFQLGGIKVQPQLCHTKNGKVLNEKFLPARGAAHSNGIVASSWDSGSGRGAGTRWSMAPRTRWMTWTLERPPRSLRSWIPPSSKISRIIYHRFVLQQSREE